MSTRILLPNNTPLMSELAEKMMRRAVDKPAVKLKNETSEDRQTREWLKRNRWLDADGKATQKALDAIEAGQWPVEKPTTAKKTTAKKTTAKKTTAKKTTAKRGAPAEAASE